MACKKSVAIIGAGPAGCMCAFYASQHAEVTIFDFKEPLTTLLCTGGGRCNLAYAEYDFKELAKFYPRGEKFLYSVFSQFSTYDTIDFFKKIGIKTYTQDDLRIFPVSNSASKVRSSMLSALSECSFVKEKVLNINLTRHAELVSASCQFASTGKIPHQVRDDKISESFLIKTDKNSYSFDSVVIAVGGHAGFELARGLGHKIIAPKPALTGLISEQSFKAIQGVSLKNIEAQILCHDTKFAPQKGDFIFTHEGISGPLAYTISSICARADYDKINPLRIKLNLLRHAELDSASCQLSNIGKIPHQVRDDRIIDVNLFQEMLNSNPKKDIKNLIGELVQKSLAEFILGMNNTALDKKCCDINGKERDCILKSLTEFEVTVISPSKEGEVVTSGGVCLDEVNAKTMESKLVNGLYFCGEVLDIDGFCGGFNLQNCWSTGFVSGSSI